MLISVIGICCGCEKQELLIPQYPLETDTIEAALNDVGLTWIITNRAEWGEGRVLYELCNTEKKGIATISSVRDGSTRTLQLNFFSSTEIDSPLPETDWEKVMRLAAILYGGFEDAGQVYEVFRDTYDDIAVVDDIPDTDSKDQKRIQWKNKINGIDCFAGFRQKGLFKENSETEIVTIFFSNKD